MSISFSNCYSIFVKRKSIRRKCCCSPKGKYYCCGGKDYHQADDWVTRLQWKVDMNNKNNQLERLSESVISPPKILILYGSLRQGSLSKALAYEAARILNQLGADIRIYHPESLPIQDPQYETHPKVQEFIQLYNWSQGQIWCSPVHHGSISSVLKNQLDWYTFPPNGRTVAFCQVQGGQLSGAAIHHMFTIALSLNMIIAPCYLIVPEAFREFSNDGRMKPSHYREKLVEVMEALYKLTLITSQRSLLMESQLEYLT
ncbi:NADPH-dependent FMN reductase ArsH [Galdieria sulphuraria]|nr:NADPH-dependent FMN reductase ArsH [Galdieria sulphuraria]